MQNKFLVDLHTHTIASGHAYSTFKENIDYARETGLLLLGISDHSPKMPYSTNDFYFINVNIIPRQFGDLRLLVGAELNIMDENGTVDLEKRFLDRIDYAIASMHPPCISPKNMDYDKNTMAFINAVKNPYVKIIGHPCDPRYPFDIKKVVQTAIDNNTLLEVNNASYNKNNGRAGGEAITVEMLKECKKQGMPIVLGSDAHFYSLIGDFSRAKAVCDEAEFPDELIINYDVEKTLDIMGIGRSVHNE